MKITPRKVDGILLLDKPLNMTSNGALQRVKRLFRAKKAGHTGSLDPLATGMLPICFGEATKFSQFLLESDKSYQVSVQLGVKTTTGDAEGDVVDTRSVEHVTKELVEATLPQFFGLQQQIPPMFSAIKLNGKPLYELARKGIEVERKSRTINIYTLQLTAFEGDTLKLLVQCSKGTYIRTLVEDIGEVLGCGAHVSGLHRNAVTPYEESKMYQLDTLEEMVEKDGLAALDSCLLPVETSVQALPAIQLSSAASFYIRMGQPVMVSRLPKDGRVRVYSENALFMGVGDVLEDGRVAPCRLVKQGQM